MHSGNIFGGIETVLLTLARCSDRKKVTHDFALCFRGRLSETLQAEGNEVLFLPVTRLRMPWQVIRARSALGRLLSTRKYDAIFCHSPWSQAIFGKVTAANPATDGLWLHGQLDPESAIDRKAARQPPTSMICNSEFTREKAEQMFAVENITVIHNAVAPPVEEHVNLRSLLSVGSGCAVILIVGRMETLKGHRELILAVADIDRDSSWECWIFGDAHTAEEIAYVEGLEALAASLDLSDRIRFIGAPHMAQDAFAAADIYCQPNIRPDAFGMTFVEALYHRLPVITTAFGGALEIVTPQTGVLVEPGTRSELTAAIQSLVHDQVKRKELGAAGPSRARAISDPDRQINKLVEWLRR